MVIVTEHTNTCFVHDNGPCDCGVEKYLTDDDINRELLEKEETKQ